MAIFRVGVAYFQREYLFSCAYNGKKAATFNVRYPQPHRTVPELGGYCTPFRLGVAFSRGSCPFDSSTAQLKHVALKTKAFRVNTGSDRKVPKCDLVFYILPTDLRDGWGPLHQTFREVVWGAGIDRVYLRFSNLCGGEEHGSKMCPKMIGYL